MKAHLPMTINYLNTAICLKTIFALNAGTDIGSIHLISATKSAINAKLGMNLMATALPATKAIILTNQTELAQCDHFCKINIYKIQLNS